jgi:hypothetical protein
VHYAQLSAAVIAFDWDSLPVVRDPRIKDDLHSSGSWWQEYNTYTTHSAAAANTPLGWDDEDDTYDWLQSRWRREDALDAVLDAQYGYTQQLAQMVAESVYPEDVELAIKHMNFKLLDPTTLDDAFEAIDHGEDIDLVLGTLFDALHVA